VKCAEVNSKSRTKLQRRGGGGGGANGEAFGYKSKKQEHKAQVFKNMKSKDNKQEFTR